MFKNLHLLTVAAMSLLSGSAASACPYCDSPTGRQVREGIFNSDFGYNVLITLVPFPVLIVIVVLIYFGLPPWLNDPVKNQGSTDAASAHSNQAPHGDVA